MKIVVIGAGLMGPAFAMDCLESDEVEEVLLMDIDKRKLEAAAEKLGRPSKLKTKVQDITKRGSLVKAIEEYDAVGIALLRWLNVEVTWGAIEAGVHAVDLSMPAEKDWGEIDGAAKRAGVTIIPGCGLEPGLTDLIPAYGMDMLDKVEAVDIYNGGIPQDPKPPLDYRIVFGGPYLPLRPGMVKFIEDGEVKELKRYTRGEPIRFDGIDSELETFYDTFANTLYEVEKFKDVKRCAVKTVRYPRWCDKVNFLDECGLLSREPIEFQGQEIVPFEVFSKVIYPKVRLGEDEKDMTVLRIIVEGVKDGCETCHTFEMVDYYDEEKGVTSMAKTTTYPAAIVSRMLARGDITERGLIPPIKVVRGEAFRRMLMELAERGVNIKHTVTTKRRTR